MPATDRGEAASGPESKRWSAAGLAPRSVGLASLRGSPMRTPARRTAGARQRPLIALERLDRIHPARAPSRQITGNQSDSE